jgi:hypothetical protein
VIATSRFFQKLRRIAGIAHPKTSFKFKDIRRVVADPPWGFSKREKPVNFSYTSFMPKNTDSQTPEGAGWTGTGIIKKVVTSFLWTHSAEEIYFQKRRDFLCDLDHCVDHILKTERLRLAAAQLLAWSA